MPEIRVPAPRSAAALAVLTLTLALLPRAGGTATLPPGFTETLIASGLSNPTAMQFAPDGRLFVCQQGGALRVIKNGALLATPFLTLSVDSNGERGLLGVAFDPNFAVNQYVYVYYTTTTVPVHNRVSRFTANGDVVVPGSEVVILDLDNLGFATNHNGGAIDFGPDGKLYIAVGENADAFLSQSLTSRFGKMLRINTDGSPAAGNPTTFPGISGATQGVYQSIWAVGLRNPFTFAFNPGGPPTMFINDVGGGSWEEVNNGLPGANYGWPNTEGYTTNPNYTTPKYAYPHSGGAVTGCAITGGAFYAPAAATFPAAYVGTYFFADYCSGWIKRIDPTLQPGVPIDFASGINLPVDLKVGPDANLYYLARGNGRVYRVQYGSAAPQITSHPANATVVVGQAATFTVGASGAPPLVYQWQRNNVDIPGAAAASYTIASPQPSDDGARFRVNVSNSAGNVFSNEATLTVTANQPPVATITAPVTGLLYAGGMTVNFAGTGVDPEDGARPASAFTWRVDFHHDTHTHPFLPDTAGITSGSFVVPTTGETAANVWFRIYLTVTDSQGRSTTVERDVFPQTVQLTLATSPAGLPLALDGQPIATPVTVTSVVGVQRGLTAADQVLNGATYAFAAWSDGGDAARAVSTPPVDTTFTATFRPVGVAAPPGPPVNLAAVVNAATVRLTWGRSLGAQRYRLDVGTTPGRSDLGVVDVGDVAELEALVPPGTYHVRAVAVNTAGASAPSNEVAVTVASTAACSVPPPVPTGFTAQTSGLVVAFAWTPAAAATGYVLEAGYASGTAAVSVPLGRVSTTRATAPAGTYFTRVRAVNACGASGPSTEVPVTLTCSATAVVPANLSVSTAGGVATFRWSGPTGATGYRLRVGSVQGGSDVADISLGMVTALNVPLAGVPSRAYFVRVVAESACGVGAPSNEVVLTVP